MRWNWAVICVAGTSMVGQGGGCSPSATVPPYAETRRPAGVADHRAAQPEPPRVASIASPFSNAALRKAWQPAEEPRNWKYLVLHHTATDQGSVESIHEAHLAKEWLGIGYHFVIGNGRGMVDGHVEPTFRWTRQLHGAHAGVKDYNELGIGVCLVGNFEEHPPTPKQLASLKLLVTALTAEYRIPAKQIVPHRDVKATACPGKFFPLDDVALAAHPAGDCAPDQPQGSSALRLMDIATAEDSRRSFDQDVVAAVHETEIPGDRGRTGGSRPPLVLVAHEERDSR